LELEISGGGRIDPTVPVSFTPIFPDASSTVTISPFKFSWAPTVLAKLRAIVAHTKMRMAPIAHLTNLVDQKITRRSLEGSLALYDAATRQGW
jgi:hypothetical protein